MPVIFCDLETFSSVDLKKSGMFKYAESPDFQILLFAYSLNGGTARIIDLAAGESLPPWLVSALRDPRYVKYAYNAIFEWGCLSKFLGALPADQWRCAMLHGLYCGYPAGLEALGKALGLESGKQKMNIGRALIRYFCAPCKPAAANGGRTRNLPRHDPERWRLFKQYCLQDVEAEMAIESKLAAFPVPDAVQREWVTDLKINARGMAVDMDLVKAALSIGYDARARLTEEAKRISGLDNPNSVSQLAGWLEAEIEEEIPNLAKETVSRLLSREGNSGAAQRMLEIRRELGKTSTKKYDAIEAAVCGDGRARGLFQFYGANRTGRWAGRLIQTQNLPRTYIEPLAFARELVKARQPEALRLVYGSVPDTLSQLIRSCFIAPPGQILIDADFSAIEARIVSWLAGEQWKLEVFKGHGKIYEAAASQMFGVPLERIVKGNPEYALRQKGKVAELACIAEGQLIQTDIGPMPIETLTINRLVWDGEAFVQHGGVIYKGRKEVITYDGLTATPDHLVWVAGTQTPIRFRDAAAGSARIQRSLYSGGAIWARENNQRRKTLENGLERPLRTYALCKLWQNTMAAFVQLKKRTFKGLSSLFATPPCSEAAGAAMLGGKTKTRESKCQKLSQLWRTRDPFLFRLAYKCRALDSAESRIALARNGIGQDRHERKLRAGEHTLGHASAELPKSAPVYDILNCGPNNRFTVNGALVHNCGYQGGPDALIKMGALGMGLTKEELPDIVARWREANKRIRDLWRSMENAAVKAVAEGGSAGVGRVLLSREFDRGSGINCLTVLLPSGRKLYYIDPAVTPNRWGAPSITYMGIGQATKRWGRVEAYGGRWVENITQAVARDCLSCAMERLEAEGYRIVAHIHDEVLIESPIEKADLKAVTGILSQPPPWAPDLPLAADGWIGPFFRKD